MSAAALEKPSRRSSGAIAALARQPLAAAGLLIVAAFVAVALAAPILPLADPDIGETANRLRPPLSGFGLLGTDQLGRDALSRLIWGLRLSLGVGAAATLAAAVVGSAIGLVAAFYGRLVDGALMRAIDVLMAFPYLLLALAVVAALGPGLLNAALAIAVANVPFFARAVRGAALGVASQPYVDAARMAGLSDARILATEILPNVAPLIIVTTATTIGWMILETAGLSFLGLGAQPPQSDLGSMLADGREALTTAPHVAAAPGLAIFLLAVGLNLLGDGLRDLLDPRLEGGRGGAPAAATAVDRPRGAASLRYGQPLLALDRLTTAFASGNARFAAAREVSFAVSRGGSLAIVGESGSGKSVTALSIARLTASPPGVIEGGAARLLGEDLFGATEERLREIRGARIAYVFQDPLTTLNPLMSVGEQIAEAVAAHGGKDPAARARRLIEEVGLGGKERVYDAYPHALSGGQRQRAGIAMALAGEADVLIADEPTTALDATTQASVLGLFSTLRRDHGATLLFVSHDLAVVAALCERIAVMYAGEIVEEGPTREVLASPRHPYTARLIACAPRLGEPERPVEPIEGAPPPLDRLPEGCAFAPRCRLAIEECRTASILLEPVDGDRAARCIRTDEVAHGRA